MGYENSWEFKQKQRERTRRAMLASEFYKLEEERKQKEASQESKSRPPESAP